VDGRKVSPPLYPAVILLTCFALLAATFGLEFSTGYFSRAVAESWSARSKFPCAGLTGELTLTPLLRAASEKLSAARGSGAPVVLLGDSTMTSSPGCGPGELPESSDLASNLRAVMPGAPVVNLAIWSGDWAILSLLVPIYAGIAKAHDLKPTLVLGLNFPTATLLDHPVLFSQLCHSVACDADCQELCLSEPETRRGMFFTINTLSPALASSVASVASYTQTFVTVAPLLQPPLEAQGSSWSSTLLPEPELTRHFSEQLYHYRNLPLAKLARSVNRASFRDSLGSFTAKLNPEGTGWRWLGRLADALEQWPGPVVILAQKPAPDYLATFSTETREGIDKTYALFREMFAEEEEGSHATWVDLSAQLTRESDYLDVTHWSESGMPLVAAAVARAVSAK
jgi:hypothetical protein